MTTASKTAAALTTAAPDNADAVLPYGTICLQLGALGVDQRGPDFPACFIEFCEKNDLYEIDSRNRRVYVYRAGRTEREVLDDPEQLDGGRALPGFVFPVRQYIFDLAGPEE